MSLFLDEVNIWEADPEDASGKFRFAGVET